MTTRELPFRLSAGRLAAAAGALVLLGACAGTGQQSSVVPARVAQETQREGWFPQSDAYERRKPGCQGECPTLKVDSLVFPGHPELTRHINRTLANMAGISESSGPEFPDIAAFEADYWQHAGARDEVVLTARVRYANRHLTVLQLDSWYYPTGAAHGISATTLVNWRNGSQKVLTLDDLLLPGKYAEFEKALRDAHAVWVAGNPDARHDLGNYMRMWPFQPTRNVGISDAGLVAQYGSYEIAPYSGGHPELLVPFDRLRGIVQPAYLPPAGG